MKLIRPNGRRYYHYAVTKLVSAGQNSRHSLWLTVYHGLNESPPNEWWPFGDISKVIILLSYTFNLQVQRYTHPLMMTRSLKSKLFVRGGGEWKCGTWKCGTIKITGVENARHEKAAPNNRGGKCEAWKCGTKWQGWKMREKQLRNACTTFANSFIEHTKMYVKFHEKNSWTLKAAKRQIKL